MHVTGRRTMLTLAVGVVVAASATADASADVLVQDPDPWVACGEDIELGVWYQSYSGGPHQATITIKTARGYTVARKTVRATTTWRYWYYTPACGRTYTVTYKTPGGTITGKVRVGS
jgi:hypothetical protein